MRTLIIFSEDNQLDFLNCGLNRRTVDCVHESIPFNTGLLNFENYSLIVLHLVKDKSLVDKVCSRARQFSIPIVSHKSNVDKCNNLLGKVHNLFGFISDYSEAVNLIKLGTNPEVFFKRVEESIKKNGELL